MKKLVVIAPTFNEASNIEAFITNVLAQKLRLPTCTLELLISDSHSSDKTPDVVQTLSKAHPEVHYLDVVNRGLGLGLIKGLDYAVATLHADLLITMEADLSNDPNQIPEFVEALSKNDLVIGSRHVAGGKIVNWSLWRKTLSASANKLLKLISGTTKTSEFTNLYRGFTRDFWLKVRNDLEHHTDWIFVPAFIFIALESNSKIAQVPIVYYDRFGGKSKMKTPSYTKNLLQYALRYRLTKHGSTLS